MWQLAQATYRCVGVNSKTGLVGGNEKNGNNADPVGNISAVYCWLKKAEAQPVVIIKVKIFQQQNWLRFAKIVPEILVRMLGAEWKLIYNENIFLARFYCRFRWDKVFYIYSIFIIFDQTRSEKFFSLLLRRRTPCGGWGRAWENANDTGDSTQNFH